MKRFFSHHHPSLLLSKGLTYSTTSPNWEKYVILQLYIPFLLFMFYTLITIMQYRTTHVLLWRMRDKSHLHNYFSGELFIYRQSLICRYFCTIYIALSSLFSDVFFSKQSCYYFVWTRCVNVCFSIPYFCAVKWGMGMYWDLRQTLRGSVVFSFLSPSTSPSHYTECYPNWSWQPSFSKKWCRNTLLSD